MVTLVGSIGAFDLRLMGWALKRQRVSSLAERLLPSTWIAFGVMVLTGPLLFLGEAATKYCFNNVFRIKMLLVLLAGINMAVFHFTVYRNVSTWDEGHTPFYAKAVGSLSFLLWAGIVLAGRWVGFAATG